MSLKIAEGTRVRVSKVVKTESNYTVVHLSSSDKRQGQDEYEYSNWPFARLVGNAHKKGVSEGQILVLKGAKISNVSYKDDSGNWKNPANPTLVVFDFDVYSNKAGGGSGRTQMPSLTDEVNENDIPF